MSLWDDLDTLHTDTQAGASALAENGHSGVPRIARRLSERTILSLLRNWLLQDYVASYTRSLAATRIFRHCYWIDGLGIEAKATIAASPPVADEAAAAPTRNGKGRKKSVQQAVPPALQNIVALSQHLAQESKPINLHGLLLASSSSKRKTTTPAEQNGHGTKNPTFNKESAIIPVPWLEIAPALLKEIEQSPAIFLLNPLAPTLFSFDDLAPLCQRTVPTELLLLLPHKQIETRLVSAQSSTPQAAAHAAALTSLLRTARWKTLPTAEDQHSQAITGFIDLLASSLQRHFLLPLQPIAFPLPIGPATVEDAPYTLLFATRRQDSLYSMNDAICLHRRRVEEQSYRGVLSEQWFIAQQQLHHNQNLKNLSLRLLRLGKNQRIRRWPDLRQQLLLERFGELTLQEYDETILKLIQNGTVKCIWRQRPNEADAVRVPGNDDTLTWQ